MNWSELLGFEAENTYKAVDNLMAMVNDEDLDWKPATGANWMTTGQLLKHMTDACGFCFKGFVTGDWGIPEGAECGDTPPEDMLPPAEALPAVESVAEARRQLEEDRRLAVEMLGSCSEEELAGKPATAPWDPRELMLGHRLLHMVGHLHQHKGQLFYYLKLQGKDVNTGHLWGA